MVLTPSQTIFISPTAFKESITARGCAEFIQSYLFNRGFRKISYFPGSDGGNGFLDALAAIYNGRYELIPTPFIGTSTITKEKVYWLDAHVVAIECASLIGLEKIPREKRNPLKYNSSPVGIAIKYLITHHPDIKEIWIGVGGTATVDMGLGILQGLNFQFNNQQGQNVQPLIQNINEIENITPPENIKVPKLKFFCDVQVDSMGPNSFALLFGPQKGLNMSLIPEIQQKIENAILKFSINREITGAGGGIGLFPSLFFECEFLGGAQFFIQSPKVQTNIQNADIIITGEGRLDEQTLLGKWLNGFTHHPKPVICLCGDLESGIRIPPTWKVFRLRDRQPDPEMAKKHVKVLIREILDELIDD